MTRLLSLCLALLPAPQDPAPPERGPHWELLPNVELDQRVRAYEAVGASGDRAQIAVLRDMLRFADTAEEWYRILDAGSAILGEPLREVEGPWRTLSLRMAGEEDWPELADYRAWKGEFYAQFVDRRMRAFFAGDVEPRIDLHEIVWGGVSVDGIPALDDPETVEAAQADFLDEEEAVFGVVLGGEARAYPLRILDWHEMANDSLGGVSFSLAYCTLCGAGVLYRTSIEGRDAPLRFGSSGLLMRSNKLMYDRISLTLWNQLTGEPVLGELAQSGLRLEALPLVATTWGRWKSQHPDTDVISTDTGHLRDYRPGASYGAYFGRPGLEFPAPREDRRSYEKEQLYVVRLPAGTAAVPLPRLREEGVVRVRVAETEVTLVCMEEPRSQALPAILSEALGDERQIEFVQQLSFELLRELLEADPARMEVIDADFLLTLPPSARLPLLEWLASDERPLALRITNGLRNRVASYGLAAEVRAFAGAADIERTGQPPSLVDANGAPWTMEEEHLSGPAGERLERLSGHLIFGFGFDAYFGDSPILR